MRIMIQKERDSDVIRRCPDSLTSEILFKVSDCPNHMLGDALFTMSNIEDIDTGFFSEVHRHDFYELLWFTTVNSDQVHYVDYRKVQVEENQLFLLKPGQAHRMEPGNKSGFLMCFAKDFFEKYIGNEILRSTNSPGNFSVVIPESWFEVFRNLANLIKTEYNGERRMAIIESYLRSLMLHCAELKKQSGATTDITPRLHTLVNLIETHYRNQRRADFYAEQVSLSSKRLNELTRDAFGRTISQMLNERLVLEAKREIGKIEKPIKEISYDLGFSEPAYFTRFFGKQTGHTPQDFRKRIASMNI
jgi:AraC family transcriptional activator of pobA